MPGLLVLIGILVFSKLRLSVKNESSAEAAVLPGRSSVF
jgi:hypothetical protein